MILRQSADHFERTTGMSLEGVDRQVSAAEQDQEPPRPNLPTILFDTYIRGAYLGSEMTLRQQLAVLTGVLVALTILVTASVSYWASSTSIIGMMDNDLRTQGAMLAYDSQEMSSDEELAAEVETFRRRNPHILATASRAESNRFVGDEIPVGGDFARMNYGADVSARTLHGNRVLVTRLDDGTVVALSKAVDPTRQLQRSIAAALLVLLSLGWIVSTLVAFLVSSSGMRPLRKLHLALKEVTRTKELKPLPVQGHDEMARITNAFNDMMASLQDSRTRQAQLVADAGHELKTPLTSMRTNIELLMMMYSADRQDQISAEDRADLERDVLAQMTEMSTLIGDLVDLAREDSSNVEFEEIRLDVILEEAVRRVERRRPDVTFQFNADPWLIMGDRFAMGRAPLNLIDNAAKWSPEGGTVRISLKAAKKYAVLVVDDSGPGIAPEERERVFERFYRSAESRSMPGSGLGLAIVKQVMDRHGARIFVEESDDHGARFRVVFPGKAPDADEDFNLEEEGIEIPRLPNKSQLS